MDTATISLIISIGAVLGTGVATFFANKKSSSEKVLRQVVADQDTRIKQLDNEVGRLNGVIGDLTDQIKILQHEKQLPLENLTKLMMKNHTKELEVQNAILELLQSMQTERLNAARRARA